MNNETPTTTELPVGATITAVAGIFAGRTYRKTEPNGFVNGVRSNCLWQNVADPTDTFYTSDWKIDGPHWTVNQ